jgi:hypothetical protein
MSPSPSGLGSRLAAGPLGLAAMAIAVSFLSQLALGKLAARDDKVGVASHPGMGEMDGRVRRTPFPYLGTLLTLQ